MRAAAAAAAEYMTRLTAVLNTLVANDPQQRSRDVRRREHAEG